jgi:predicted aspartyl protease
VSKGAWTRRAAGAGLAALAGACAASPRAPPILVNLAGAQAPPPPDGALPNAAPTAADLAGRVTVGVYLDGQGPFDFVVDSGANRTVLSAELAQALRLPPMDPAPVHGIAGVEPAPTALVEELRVGLVRSRKLRLPVLPRARLGVDGLLGVDVLRGRRVRIDFLRRELKIEISEGRRGSDVNPFDMRRNATGALPEVTAREIVVPARFRFGQLIIVAAEVARKPVTAFLDSGSQSTVGNLALRRAVLGTTRDPKARRYMTPLYSATGQTAEGELAELPPLRIGGLTLRNVLTAFADLHVFDLWRLQDRPTILIGVDVMKAFEAVTLDFGRREVVFTLPARRR